MTRRPVKALVIGAGIGGLAAAIALRRARAGVEVFERAGRIEEVGAGLAVWANGMRALDRLGVGDAVRAASVESPMGASRTGDGRVLTAMSLPDLQRVFEIPIDPAP